MFFTYLPSPLGELLLAGSEDALALIGFPSGSMARRPEDGWERADEPFAEAARQVQAYFDGRLRVFDLPCAPSGTPFQSAVHEALRGIPYGETRTYADIARAIGAPQAVRAVGAANARNPLPIITPCHRVVGRDGSLTGFGGGLPAKRYLLEHEKRNAAHC